MNKLMKPDYAIHPGVSLRDALDTLSMTQSDLSKRTGVSIKHINEIIKGQSPITPETALKLEYVLDISISFWLGIQNAYDEFEVRQKANIQNETENLILAEIPYLQMAKLNWLPQTKERSEKIDNLRKYFAVENLALVAATQAASFRTSTKYKPSPYALAAWLRKGEVEASNINTGTYSEQGVLSIIPELKKHTLTKRNVGEVIQDLLAPFGVVFVALPHLERTYIQGAAYWLSADKAVVQVSIRHKYSDIFWFSLFHELGHLVKHRKKVRYLDMVGSKNNSKEEIEADLFAANSLIDRRLWMEYITNTSQHTVKTVTKFSKEMGVHPGIIVGRLQHERRVQRNRLNTLRGQYVFIDESD